MKNASISVVDKNPSSAIDDTFKADAMQSSFPLRNRIHVVSLIYEYNNGE
jgi:hypothetical protein